MGRACACDHREMDTQGETRSTEDAVFSGAMRAIGATLAILLLIGVVIFAVVAMAGSDDELGCSVDNLSDSTDCD